jgi:hypothetical protein
VTYSINLLHIFADAFKGCSRLVKTLPVPTHSYAGGKKYYYCDTTAYEGCLEPANQNAHVWIRVEDRPAPCAGGATRSL